MKKAFRLEDTKKSRNVEGDITAIREATRAWIKELREIPQSLVVKLIQSGDKIIEITPPTKTEHDTPLPIWGTMWGFSDSRDNYWLEDERNLQAMADCGFRIYEQEDYGYIFGIDGGGYDIIEAHWIPLYKARGLMWHLV